MAFSAQNRANTLHGILFVALFATSATYIAQFNFFQQLAISPLIIGIVLGFLYANTLRNQLPQTWLPGIIFSTKSLLRIAIALYGFRLTFQNVMDIGVNGILIALFIISFTFILGYMLGTKVFKLDKQLTILICAGSSICGAAAVLATEPVIKAPAYKSSIAVATVVLFGSIAMFLYPFLYFTHLLNLTELQMATYIGATLHEVAHVTAAGFAINEHVANYAVIVKMLRVMMLAPFLIILSFWLKNSWQQENLTLQHSNKKMSVPWFAIAFIGVVAFNSFGLLTDNLINSINSLDTFLLTMAMTALGMETRLENFKEVGLKPIYLAAILFLWLLVSGYYLVNTIM